MQQIKSKDETMAYLEATLDLLKRLDKKRIERNNLAKEAESEMLKRRNRFSFQIGISIGIVLTLLDYFMAKTAFRGIWQVENLVKFSIILVIVTSAFLTLLSMSLWNRHFFTTIEEQSRKEISELLSEHKERLFSETKALLENELFLETMIPKKYLSPQSITFMLNYVRTNQASTVQVAVKLFEQDISTSQNRYARFLAGEDSLYLNEVATMIRLGVDVRVD
jgi:hypothetical protein